MTDLSKCPECGGEADNGHDRCLPPNVYTCTKCMAPDKVEETKDTYKCKKCGSTDFWLDESIGWKCYVDDENNLNCKLTNNDINGIFCSHCGEEVKKGLDAFNDWNY